MIIYKERFMKNAPSERDEQVTFFNQLRKHKPHLGEIAIHIKNEGKRNINQVNEDKANGMVTGAVDVVIPGEPTLLIELKKRSKRAKVSDAQVNYMESAARQGAMCYVCYGWEMAMEAVEEWENARNR